MKPAVHEGPKTFASTRQVWRLASILGVISIPSTVVADGLFVRLRAIQNGCEVSVLTSDQILAREQSEFEVLVQQSDSGQLVPDAVVAVAFRPDVIQSSQTTPEFCNPVAPGAGQLLQTKVEGFSVKVMPRSGAAGIYYSAPVTFPVQGIWQMEVNARSDHGQISANGSVLVSAADGRWRLLWPYFAAPIATIFIFAANQWLRMCQLQPLGQGDSRGATWQIRRCLGSKS